MSNPRPHVTNILGAPLQQEQDRSGPVDPIQRPADPSGTPSGALPTWKCPTSDCKLVFRSLNELRKHQFVATHYRCDDCGFKFRDQDAVHTHKGQVHAKEQSLMCPGCGATFTRAGSLMHHVESRGCPVITPEFLHQRREKQIAFGEALRKMNAANSDLVLAGVDALEIGDKHRPWSKPDNNIPNYGDTSPSLAQDLKEYHSGDAKQSDLLSADEPKKPMVSPVRDVPNRWDESRHLLPQTAEQQRPSARQLQDFTTAAPSTRDISKTERVVDPDAHNYNPAVFYHSILGKFKCPHDRCSSRFDKAGSLTAHLRSPAHKLMIEFKCPRCLRMYSGMAAAMQHCEAASRTCIIRETGNFRQFVDHVSAGMLDGLNGATECLSDGNPRFLIPAAFIADLPTAKPYVRKDSELQKLGRGRMEEWEEASEMAEEEEKKRSWWI